VGREDHDLHRQEVTDNLRRASVRRAALPRVRASKKAQGDSRRSRSVASVCGEAPAIVLVDAM
jgi:hypothetical protein